MADVEDVSKFIPPPDESQTIWRYLDFTKLVAVLEARALFFARVSSLDDPFEGSFPSSQTVLQRVMGAFKPGTLPPGTTINLESDIEQAWKTMRYWAMVNCWHASEHESAAMWQLYASNSRAVAIRSTVARLRAAIGRAPAPPSGFGGSDWVHIGMIEYIDYAKDRIPDGSFAAQFFRKRRSFEHERELRAMVLQFPRSGDGQRVDFERRPSDAGLLVPVDLNTLVEGIAVAPSAPTWFVDLVRRVVQRYGLNVVPKQSDLDAAPLY